VSENFTLDFLAASCLTASPAARRTRTTAADSPRSPPCRLARPAAAGRRRTLRRSARSITVTAPNQELAAQRGERHRVCSLHRFDVSHDGGAAVVMTRYVVAALFFPATIAAAQETGLSKGPLNPADIGTRCAVMAGRNDRAYLNCLEQHGATVSPPAKEGARNQRRFTDHPGDGQSPAGRYLRRGR
jgi:hypothetical protein